MTRYVIEPSSLMLSEAELCEVKVQLDRFATATATIQAFLSSVTVKLRIVTPSGIRHGIDQRISAQISVRFDAGYNILQDVENARRAYAAGECDVQRLYGEHLAETSIEHARILNDWVLRDLANGQDEDVVAKVNSTNQGLIAAARQSSEQPTVFVGITYALNGAKEIRSGVDGYSSEGVKLVAGLDYPGVLVKRESNVNVLEAVIDALRL